MRRFLGGNGREDENRKWKFGRRMRGRKVVGREADGGQASAELRKVIMEGAIEECLPYILWLVE